MKYKDFYSDLFTEIYTPTTKNFWLGKHGILGESNQTDEEYRKSWLERHEAEFDERGRLIAYHGTPTKNLKSIKQNGFRYKSYFSLRPEYSQFMAHRYHDTPKEKVTVLKVHLPLEKIDFVMSDVYATEVLKWNEVSPEKVEVSDSKLNESDNRETLYKKSKELYDKLQKIRDSVPRYYDTDEYVQLRKEFSKVSDEIEDLDLEEEPNLDINKETDSDFINYEFLEKIASKNPKNYILSRLVRYKGKQWASEFINVRNGVIKKVKELTRNVPYVNYKSLKSDLLNSDDSDKTKMSDFFPVIIEVSSSPSDDMTISVTLEENGKFSGIFEGNDEASMETIRLVNKLINPSGKFVKIYGTHGRDVTEKIKSTNELPENLYVSPDREYSSGYMDLEGDREKFTGYVNINDINQESDVDWKTITKTEIKNFRYL
jgi:hypothetical protein